MNFYLTTTSLLSTTRHRRSRNEKGPSNTEVHPRTLVGGDSFTLYLGLSRCQVQRYRVDRTESLVLHSQTTTTCDVRNECAPLI